VARITAPLALLSLFLRAERCSVALAVQRLLPKALLVAFYQGVADVKRRLRCHSRSRSSPRRPHRSQLTKRPPARATHAQPARSMHLQLPRAAPRCAPAPRAAPRCAPRAAPRRAALQARAQPAAFSGVCAEPPRLPRPLAPLPQTLRRSFPDLNRPPPAFDAEADAAEPVLELDDWQARAAASAAARAWRG
jgi:hypothetical protein